MNCYIEKRFTYDTLKYPYSSIFEKIFNWHEPLDEIHRKIDGSSNFDILGFSKDQSTIFHDIYYNSEFLDELLKVYNKFIRDEIFTIFPDQKEIIYQRKPTFRICLPNNVAVGEWHTDSQYNHPTQEINFWLPITDSFDTNSLWVESYPGKRDYHSFDLKYGEYMKFYGNQCTHGNKINSTGKTRLSIDFRIILGTEWDTVTEEERNYKTIKSGMTFTIGSYFQKMINPMILNNNK
jgi:hypothetical protein